MPGGVLWGGSATAWRVAAAALVAAAATSAATAAPGPRSSITRTAWTVHFHTDIRSFPLMLKN